MTDASAYRAAIVYSLISTCKAANVDPRIWMEDVLRKIPYYQRDQRNTTGKTKASRFYSWPTRFYSAQLGTNSL